MVLVADWISAGDSVTVVILHNKIVFEFRCIDGDLLASIVIGGVAKTVGRVCTFLADQIDVLFDLVCFLVEFILQVRTNIAQFFAVFGRGIHIGFLII